MKQHEYSRKKSGFPRSNLAQSTHGKTAAPSAIVSDKTPLFQRRGALCTSFLHRCSIYCHNHRKEVYEIQQFYRLGSISFQTIAQTATGSSSIRPDSKLLHQKYNGSIDSSRFPTKPLHIMQQLHQCERISVQPHSINIKKSKK